MQLKRFILTFIAFAAMGGWCLPTSTPSALHGAREKNSGIKGTTRSIVVSGVPGGPTIGGPASVEFAIAPVAAEKPVYDKAFFVNSDAQGTFEVEVPQGTYWIGPKAKALDPTLYVPGPVVFSEMFVVVTGGSFISVELVQTAYAP